MTMKEPSNNWRKRLCVCPAPADSPVGWDSNTACAQAASPLLGCSRTQNCSFVYALLHASTLGIYRMGIFWPVLTLHSVLQRASLPRVAAVVEAVPGAPAQRGDARKSWHWKAQCPCWCHCQPQLLKPAWAKHRIIRLGFKRRFMELSLSSEFWSPQFCQLYKVEIQICYTLLFFSDWLEILQSHY